MANPTDEAEIQIFDGETPLETRRCRVVLLNSGSSAAVWRGLAFPILPGNRIDAAGDAWPIADLLPNVIASQKFAIIDGQSEAYIVVSGSFIEVETISGKIQNSGISVLRTGRYFGEKIGDVDADWFIRIIKPSGNEDLSKFLEPILGTCAARPTESSSADLRSRILIAELLSSRAREAGLSVEVARLRSALAEGLPEAERQAVALREALEHEQLLRLAAERAAVAASAVVEDRPKPMPSGRIIDEVRDVLAGLLPNVRMLRDSAELIAVEFASRQGVWRALGELASTGGIPRDWKKIHGAEGWWERHIINGRDNTGRIYVRKSARSGWDVLVSHKAEQPRDIAWLNRQ